jgi:TonB family protein
MNPTYPTRQSNFGLLPDPERNPASVVTSFVVNGVILALLIVFGTVAHHEIQLRKMESTEIYFPKTLPPPIKIKVRVPPPPKVEPKLAKLESPRIVKPRVEPKPEFKPLPIVKEAIALPAAPAKPKVVLAPQPKLALAAAPALTPQTRPSVQPVHLGDMNGVKPNPDASRPATIAALGNPYGGQQGPSAAPRGVVGSTGFGNGTRSGSSIGGSGGNGGGYGGQGRVAAVGLPGAGSANSGSSVASAPAELKTTPPVLLSHAQPEYTSEARQLKIEGDVVLRVTITAGGQMLVHSVIRGLGHGLDDAAMRSAASYKFKPATRDGQPVDYTTNIIIKFQTA